MLKTLKSNFGIFAILVCALLLRLPLLDGSVWLDEAAQILESERSFSQQIDIIDDFQPPLLHYILHGALQFSDSVVWLRIIGAVIPGLITIFYTYKIGTIIYSKQVGLLASALLSLSSFHIFYSQELRPYSLPSAFALISWYQIVKVTRTDDKKKPLKPFFIFSISTILGLYSSYLYPFLYFSQLLYLLFHSKRWLPHVAISAALSIVAFLPWVPTFIKQLSAGGLVRDQLVGWSEIVSIPQLKAIPLTFGKFIYGILPIETNLFFLVTGSSLALVGLATFIVLYGKNFKQSIQDNALTITWLIVPLVSSWLISFFIPVVQPKRVLFLLPAFFLVCSAVISKIYYAKSNSYIPLFTTLRITTTKVLAVMFASILVYIHLHSIITYWTEPSVQRENWQALHAEIQSQFPVSETVLLFSFPEPFASWQYYDRNEYPTFSTGTLNIASAPNITERLKTLERYRYLLVFDYLRDLTDPNDVLLQEITAFGYKEVQVLDYPGIGFVRVYTKPDNILSATF